MKTRDVVEGIFGALTSESCFQELATDMVAKIKDEANEALYSGKPIQEVAGIMALGVQLEKFSKGLLNGRDADNLFRMLIDKKTSSPVMKTENTTFIDVKQVMSELISESEGAIDYINKQADIKRTEIRDKLKADARLMLNKDNIVSINQNEPEEIRRLRESANS